MFHLLGNHVSDQDLLFFSGFTAIEDYYSFSHFTHFLINQEKKYKILVRNMVFQWTKHRLCISNFKEIKFEKKNALIFFVLGVADLYPLGAQISGTKEKFKNPLDDVICIDMSYLPLPQMATHYLWSRL